MNQRNNWEELYEAAILETDRSKLNERIDAALVAIESRLQALNENQSGDTEEQQAIRKALKGLGALREKAPPR